MWERAKSEVFLKELSLVHVAKGKRRVARTPYPSSLLAVKYQRLGAALCRLSAKT